ncbi:Spo0E family sporulation regulatory protein-aspartic acid phosphatase [Clostridium neuense]|uniref:Spo0E family sporulation regulatory protein-aspartic acid phosphatase n=1 Tax=Clostridium neuense TaxID=1728934 RepID=A0ABW8TJZ2_9CLOT
MSKIQDIEVEIQRLREKLTELIEQKENLLNPEVIAASKVLDSSLNEYSEIISERVEK